MLKMKRLFSFATIGVFLIQIIQSSNVSAGVVPPGLNMSADNYGKYAENFVSQSLSGTKFCESILLPTDHALLKKSLQATLFNAKRNGSDLDDTDRLDSCCRSFHKCEAFKNSEEGSDRNDSSITYCECVYDFRACLTKLNTSISGDLAFIQSINTTKCYANDHPIAKCIKFKNYVGPRTADPTFNVTRCKQYELDYSQPKKLQIFDLPLIDSGIFNITAVPVVINQGDYQTESQPQILTNTPKSQPTVKPYSVEVSSTIDPLARDGWKKDENDEKKLDCVDQRKVTAEQISTITDRVINSFKKLSGIFDFNHIQIKFSNVTFHFE